ncbi:MAG: two-component sensor histidine kinase, partial [Bacteroidia bacterium]|nr:two-component sensor histidine kinase [Bacteroidia bacterium]
MSLSLIGIIFVQAYYINNTVNNEKEQFTFKVKRALSYTSTAIEDREFRNYVEDLQNFIAEGGEPDSTSLRQLTFLRQDEDSNELIVYRNGIFEENYRIPSFIDIGLDSVNISRILNERQTKVYSTNTLDGSLQLSPEKSIQYITELSRLEKETFESAYRDQAKRIPIHRRVSKGQIEYLLSKKLLEDNIDIDFEYAIYAKDLATKIQSDNFELARNSTIGVPIFLDNNNASDFTLYVNFPERKRFILSSIIGMTLLSIIFTTIIIIAYTSAIYQLIKQRQISQIKTDFINNMTHEFKTPIATINLALDAIKNPQIINDEDKVKRYLKMIKDENKRMHAQVENVLRISKLDKNELNISKDRVK